MRPSGYRSSFNSRAREGRDGEAAVVVTDHFRFNSRAREGRDFRLATPNSLPHVSIHAPARGATIYGLADLVSRHVSIHAPARGATWLRRCGLSAVAFQFTRPRGARPDAVAHAPPLGAFQFTRPRGARQARPPWNQPHVRRFNSRAREGRDGAAARLEDIDPKFQFTRPRGARPKPPPSGSARSVSIHAPARGATSGRARSPAGNRFNSRAREGRDEDASRCTFGSWRFNSRAREGRDLAGMVLFRPDGCFNSRAREGRDAAQLVPPGVAAVSIHAPARGATGRRGAARNVRGVSIHAPARGATFAPLAASRRRRFQFTRPRGARQPSASQ